MKKGSNWAQRGHFSPQLREERRVAGAKMKAERESRRCLSHKILFRTIEDKRQHIVANHGAV